MAAKKSAPKTAAKKADTNAPAKKAAPAKAAKAPAAPAKKVAPQKASSKEDKPAVKVAGKASVEKSTPSPSKAAPAAPAKPVAAKASKNEAPKVSKEESTPPAINAAVAHSPAFVDKQKQRLLDLRDELVDAMTGTTRDTIRNAPEGSEASGSGMHQGDAGSDAYDRDFALSVLAKEQDALYEIEQALQRIKKGTYGVCELSGRKIPTARLEAIPFARLTVECQAQWEKEYGNRRFRPSNEVGFSGGNYADDEDSDAVSLDEDDD